MKVVLFPQIQIVSPIRDTGSCYKFHVLKELMHYHANEKSNINDFFHETR